MNRKISIGVLAAIIVAIIVGVYVANDNSENDYESVTETDEVANDAAEAGSQDEGKLLQGTASFGGTLDAVSTACFADGVCSATVEGKVVTLLIGWNSETVGEVRFANGIAGLKAHIGNPVFVFAAETEDGYTLYGSEDYYIEPAI